MSCSVDSDDNGGGGVGGGSGVGGGDEVISYGVFIMCYIWCLLSSVYLFL